MSKLVLCLFVSTLLISGCILEENSKDRSSLSIAKDYLETNKYTDIELQHEAIYHFKKEDLIQLPHMQYWGVQSIKPDRYIGENIESFTFSVKNHPINQMFASDNNFAGKVMVTVFVYAGEVIGGYAVPMTKYSLYGSVFSLDGKTIEEVQLMDYPTWQNEWLHLYGDTNVNIIPTTNYSNDTNMIELVISMRKARTAEMPLYEVYRDLPVIDVHSHDAYAPMWKLWEEYGIDKTVLFGNVSEPKALRTDALAWQHYKSKPDAIYPSFAGIPLRKEENGIEIVKEKLEKGYLNIGEIYAASKYSPSANVKWKGNHPMWEALPDIYTLAAKYKVPIMLHIDPPFGDPIASFYRALQEHPNTTFVFAHGNVFNSPRNIEAILKKFDNVYIDFFAGFTHFNKNSNRKLEDYVPLIEAYPNRFLLGADSGIEIGQENAFIAIYELIDLLSPETAVKVAYQNYERLIEEQPPTKTQIFQIKQLSSLLAKNNMDYYVNKRKANELIFQLEDELKSK